MTSYYFSDFFLTNFVPLILIFGLTMSLQADEHIGYRVKRLMYLAITIVCVLFIQTYAQLQYAKLPHYESPRMFLAFIGYVLKPVILLVLYQVISSKKLNFVLLLPAIINTLVFSTCFFTDIAFGFNEANIFHRGPAGYTVFLVSGFYLSILLYQSIKHFTYQKTLERFVVFFLAITIIVASIIEVWEQMPSNVLNKTIVCSLIFYYFSFHLHSIKEHEEALLTETQIRLMVSQIQPHFLYNTLSTIQVLCEQDPKLAAKTIGQFSTYLRNNLDTVDIQTPIPFKEELSHTMAYVDIEQLRFPNVSVRFETEATDFQIPALSLQPLVENAIRHGVRIRKQGIIHIHTFESDEHYVIVISDNGKGFDTSLLGKQEGSHVGISNVRTRLEKMCQASLEIDSTQGYGTIVTIKVPKNPEHGLKRGGI